MAGISEGPTPWWQTGKGGENGLPINNLSKSAPPGYKYDPVSMGFTPIAGSPSDQLDQRARTQSMENTRFAQGTQAFNDQESALKGLMGSLGSAGGGGTSNFNHPASIPPVSGGGVGGSVTTPAQVLFTPPGGGGPSIGSPHISSVQAPNVQPILDAAGQAQQASFGQAKAQAGSLGQSALGGLRASLAGRGIAGSGVESRGLVDRLAAATNPLSDLNTAALHENVGIAQHGADQGLQAALAGYQGDISQRGQDLTAAEGAASRALQAATTGYQGGITQRGQDISKSEGDASRNLQASMSNYQGGITQRGQNIGEAEASAQLAATQRAQQQAAIQAALAGLTKLY